MHTSLVVGWLVGWVWKGKKKKKKKKKSVKYRGLLDRELHIAVFAPLLK